MNKVTEGSVALVAFGGNAFIKKGQQGSVAEQRVNANEMCQRLMTFIERGYELVITHGNGPQVGNLLIQNEMARGLIPDLPLDVLVAETGGSLGYLLQQELLNHLRPRRAGKYVVTMITQVLVDRADPAFSNPTKPVGPFYSKQESGALRKKYTDWKWVEDSGRGYRRIVPSPSPIKVVQQHMIRALVYAGNVVIALGGGGVPIAKDEGGAYVGVEAVVDKDLSSALLATDIKADMFVLLTGVEKVSLNFGKKDEEPLDVITYEEAQGHLAQGHFPPGSMGPKITSALMYLEAGGREAIITNAESLDAALDGNAGTRIVWKR